MIHYLLQVHWDYEGSGVRGLFAGYPSMGQLRKALKDEGLTKQQMETLHKEKSVRHRYTTHDITVIEVIQGANNG